MIQTESVAEVDEPGSCISVVLSFFALCPSYPNTYARDILVSALPILPLAKFTGHLGSRSSTRFGQTRGRSFLALLDLAVQRVFVGLPSPVWVPLLPAPRYRFSDTVFRELALFQLSLARSLTLGYRHPSQLASCPNLGVASSPTLSVCFPGSRLSESIP